MKTKKQNLITVKLKRIGPTNAGYYGSWLGGMPYSYQFSRCEIVPREKVAREKVATVISDGRRAVRMVRFKDAVSIPGVQVVAAAKNGAQKRRTTFQISREDLDEFIAALQTMRNVIDEETKD